ncbi:MAG: FtsB family cell division protein [Candidatus Saccharimonadales bacterium]
MFDKIKKYQNHPYLLQFRDVRAVGLAVFGVIALMVTWSGIKAVQTNYSLQKQISSLQQQNDVAALQNNNLKLQNQYLETDQFLELTARREFGLAAPGEKVLLVPPAVALAHARDLSVESDNKQKVQTIDKPLYQQNFEHWIDFFLHRPITQ